MADKDQRPDRAHLQRSTLQCCATLIRKVPLELTIEHLLQLGDIVLETKSAVRFGFRCSELQQLL